MAERLQKLVELEILRFEQMGEMASRRWPESNRELPQHVMMLGHGGVASQAIDLTVMAITHGNEVAGLRAINDAAELIIEQSTELKISICLILGNVGAARANKRFLESDLNRAFATSGSQLTTEMKRALVLSPILAKSQFFLDIHQTREPSATPFFIFPHQRSSLNFAMSISNNTPVVTHWGEAFSHDGMCTDEYVNSKGGIGITIELGQNGFGEFSVGAGMRCMLRAISSVTKSLAHSHQEQHKPETLATTELYTWQEILNYPAQGTVELRPGLINFSHVKAEEVIGQINGGPLQVAKGGYLLFPYYAKPGDTKRPTEICRVMRRITPSELPE